jgi:hypothetical protein
MIGMMPRCDTSAKVSRRPRRATPQRNKVRAQKPMPSAACGPSARKLKAMPSSSANGIAGALSCLDKKLAAKAMVVARTTLPRWVVIRSPMRPRQGLAG